MLGKITRRVRAGPSSNKTRFDKDVFIRSFFPSLTKFYEENPDLRASMQSDFRPNAVYLMEDMNPNPPSDDDNMNQEHHPLAKRPRLPENPSNSEDLASAGNSQSPGELPKEEDYYEDDVETVSFQEFVDRLASRYSKIWAEQTQIYMTLRLLTYISNITPNKPKELERSFYGFDSNPRLPSIPKPKN